MSRRSWPRRLINRLEVDQAVFYALVLRGWQLGAGMANLLLIAFFFTPDLQGFYYTFGSLAALQTFFELGFSVAVINLASHEWAHLKFTPGGEVEGDVSARSRLASLASLLRKWYLAAAALFVVGVGAAGAVFLNQDGKSGQIDWLSPWAATAAFTGLSLYTMPFAALLEGCGQAATVNRFRFAQAVLSSLAIWAAIGGGLGLWAVAAASAARSLCDAYLIFIWRRPFFRSLRIEHGVEMDWRHEIWPLQWRMAVQGLLGYFAFALFTPIMFHYRGPAVAGQMGMTWGVISIVQAAAFAWVQARAGLLGLLAAKRDFVELDRVFFRVAGISWAAIALAGVGVCVGTFAMQSFTPKLAHRILPIEPTIVLMLGSVLSHALHCQALYVRAHKQDPFLLFGFIKNLATGLLVWQLGKAFGALGAAVGFTLVVALYALPASTWIWMRCRRERRIGIYGESSPNSSSPRSSISSSSSSSKSS